MRQAITRLSNLVRDNERGQLVLFVAGAMVVVIGFAALAVDLGLQTHTRRGVQNDADAIALAAVRELPDEADADTIALDWANRNGVDVSEIKEVVYGETCSGTAVDGTATVRLERNQRTFFAQIFGIGSADINVCATARIGVAAAGTGMMPFGFHVEDPYPGANPDDVCYFFELDGSTNPNLWNDPCLLKIPSPSDSWGNGNSGPVRLDEGGDPLNYDPSCSPGSSGASEYSENIEDGSECWYAIDDDIRPKTGNMKGPTCSGVDDRLDGNTDSLTDVFGTPDADGVYNEVDVTNARYALVPIVTVSGTGTSADVTITGFITVYLDGACSGGGCNGNGSNPACVVVTPVKTRIFLAGLDFGGGAAIDDETNALFTIKLVE